MWGLMGYIEGESIGEAYFKAYRAILEAKSPHWYLMIHISQPILVNSIKISSLDVNDWRKVINVDDRVYEAFVSFKFSKKDGWTGGYSGEDWINGRIQDLFNEQGYYKRGLSEEFSFDQLLEVEKRLSARDKNGKKNAWRLNKRHGMHTILTKQGPESRMQAMSTSRRSKIPNPNRFQTNKRQIEPNGGFQKPIF